MQVSSASPWPLRVAYVAAAVFLGASGAINLTYGWQKGTEAELADVGRGLGRRRRGVCSRLAGSHPLAGRGPLVSHGRCGRSSPAAGSYSITAALGSAAGSRYNAASVEQSTTETRKSAQAAYDDFRAALADLAPSRPLGEVEAALAIARPSCRNTTLNGRRDVFCYLSAIGLEATPERLNDILTLLAVVIIEAGGGLAPALGLALSERPAEGSPERHRTQPETPNVSAIVQRPIVRPTSVATGSPLTVDVQPSACGAWRVSSGARHRPRTVNCDAWRWSAL